MKNIAVDSVLTPSVELAFAKNALGLQEVPSAVRLSEGSLLASLLALVAAPLAVVIAPSKVLALDMTLAGNTGVSGLPGIKSDLSIDAVSTVTFTALESSLKSKPLEVDGFPVVVNATINSVAPADPYVAGVMVPAVPSFTALALVNRLVSIAEELGEGAVIVVDQVAENVTFYKFPTPADASAALDNGITSAITAEYLAAYDLTIPTAADPNAPSTAWE